jgi:hypothetical protein
VNAATIRCAGRASTGEFVVAAAQILQEGVPGDHHLCGAIRP